MSTDDYSGAEIVNFSIIDSLKDKYDFYWVSKEGNINNFLTEKKIKWIRINKLSVKEIKRIVLQYQPDILHATDFRASSICAIAHPKVPLIAHLHNNALWIRRLCLKSLIFLFAGLKSDAILTVSEAIEKEYIFSKYIKNKLHCVGNPVSRKKIIELAGNEKSEKKYDICCVARLTEAKNPILFLQIVSDMISYYPNIKAVWVGDGEYKNIVINMAKSFNILNNIDFVGFQKNPYSYMKKSKIFVLTSKWEGYGLAAFEALSLGLPCIVSGVGGLKQIVTSSCGYICNIKSDYVFSIKELMENRSKYNELSKEAIIQSKKLDNINKYMDSIDSIYKGVLINGNKS